MKGRRAERRSRCARDTLSRPVVHPLPFLPPCHPFLSAVFPMGNVVTYRSSWKPAPIEMETQPWDALPVLFLFLSFSDVALRPLSLSRRQRIRISLSPSFPNYLSPHRAPSYHPAASLSSSSDRPRCEILFPSPSRTLASQSPGLVSLTHARRIVMGNVQMH